MDRFVADRMERRLADGRRFWDAVPNVPDMPCAWQTLLKPKRSRGTPDVCHTPDAHGRSGLAISNTMCPRCVLGFMGGRTAHDQRTHFASRRHGGAHHGPARTTSRMLFGGTPRVSRTPSPRGVLVETKVARAPGRQTTTEQRRRRTKRVATWLAVLAVLCSDTFFRKNSLMSDRTAARRARLRSHSGRNAGAVFADGSTSREYHVAPRLFRVLLLERLQPPLQVSEATCNGCRSPHASLRRHRAIRPHSGRLRKRGTPIAPLARILLEAGARVTAVCRGGAAFFRAAFLRLLWCR